MSVPDSQVRKNLVVVRAGKNSLHPRWLNGEQGRNWDLVVSLYDPDARFQHPDDVVVVARRGGKWDGLHAFFANCDILSRYDYIWLPDDDIETSASAINAIFDDMRRHALDAAQPSLTRNSYFSFFALTSCPGYLIRYTNFIETMAPCLKSSVLQAVLADFEGSMSGFGLDYIWCRLSHDNRFKAAILDHIAVRHTRPVGGSLRGVMEKSGVSAEDEERKLYARYNIRYLPKKKIVPLVYAAIDLRQRRRIGSVRLGLEMAAAYLSVFPEFTAQEDAGRKIKQFIQRQFIRRVDLSQLQRCNPE
ncbi:MAG: hypothetical protein ABSA66_03390 [Roseiarcus sp.]|jgi:hypothetical protein